MVVVLCKGVTQDQKLRIKSFLEEKGYTVREIVGQEDTILGAIGLSGVDIREVELLPGVDRVIPITKPYKLASREFKKEDTVVSVGPVRIGGPRIVVIAGPCAVESRDQILETAEMVREAGAVMIRGGCFKPRTSPYAFQGLGFEGLEYLAEAGKKTGLPVVTEVVSSEHLSGMKDLTDVFQIGTRNMQNFELLKRVGALGKPVLLKRGFSSTIQEWLMAAEYLLAHGTDNVILCERGIRTFETYTRNTLDVSAIPVVKKLSHLPIIVDPSHATGIRAKVPPMALAAVAAGADGIEIEVHPRPDEALSDGPQSLFPDQFERLMRDIEVLSPVEGKELTRVPRKSGRARAVPGSPLAGAPGAEGSRPEASRQAAASVSSCAFQGERGAFSEQALHRYFDSDEIRAVPKFSFTEVFDSVLSGETEYGILPIENSLSGSIHENYDLLLQYPDCGIVGEKKIRIVHALIGLPGSTIEGLTRIYSHPQGLAQCGRFLEGISAVFHPYYDTAGSVAFIAKEGNPAYGAIASVEAAKVHGMSVLKEGIETNPRSYTRFFIIRRREQGEPEEWNKASLVFAVPDTPGSLFECLRAVAERKLNMKKLESRPIQGKPWQYMFYVDVEVGSEKDALRKALDELSRKAIDLRILGQYRGD